MILNIITKKLVNLNNYNIPTILNIPGLLLNSLEELLTDAIESVGVMHVEVEGMTEEGEAAATVEIGNVDVQYATLEKCF